MLATGDFEQRVCAHLADVVGPRANVCARLLRVFYSEQVGLVPLPEVPLLLHNPSLETDTPK